MNNTKYVVLNYQNLDTMFIFPDYVTHSDFVQSMDKEHSDVVSAGFIMATDDGLKTYGQSVSLGVGSIPSDQRLLDKMLGVEEFIW